MLLHNLYSEETCRVGLTSIGRGSPGSFGEGVVKSVGHKNEEASVGVDLYSAVNLRFHDHGFA